jgi:plasmid stabilization system protein ParE
MKIIWSPLSVDRMTEISEYIAEDNPDASIKWVESIFEIIDRLKQFPESGRIVPEIDKPHIREIIQGNYRIIYKVRQEEIFILTVRHFKQILPSEEVNE